MIKIKNETEIEYMRQAGKVVEETLLKLEELIKPGITTAELDSVAESYIKMRGAYPSFKGYCGFPASICTSVNNEVIHGIPSKSKVLQEGDIISIDCGAVLKGYQGDAARTFPVGKISKEAAQLIKITKESFFKGIEKAVEGNRLFDISYNIQKYVEDHGCSVVRQYVGHGIGKEMHEDPAVPNYGLHGTGPKLLHGMVLAIEPMVNVGTYRVHTEKDNWTVVTDDGSLSAHYENTVAVLKDGFEILTFNSGRGE